MATPKTSELVARIRMAGALLPHRYAAATALAKIYEAYVWVLTVEAAQRAARRRCVLENVVAGQIRLAGSPVPITSGYTYARFPGYGVEVHAGIQVVGRSGVAHELDISVLHAAPARRGRRGRPMRSHHVVLGIEAKCYRGDLGPGIGRSVLGLNSDTYCPLRLVTNTRDYKARRMLVRRTLVSRGMPHVRPANPLVEEWAIEHFKTLV